MAVETSSSSVSDSVQMECSFAVEVSDAVYMYGKGERSQGLRGVNLKIPKGIIYALLGPSGCGKTTLMRSLVGLQSLQSGQTLMFGKKPGVKDSGVPGPWIGYMPQDVCLYPDLTADNHLKYFGSLLYMSSTSLQERTEFLLKLLEINSEQTARNMSGGQRRRLSLAIALVHDPPLLVLDEPTVGVDPCLRKSIWDYLSKLPSTQGTTILFSTHQTEEASRRATLVGFMREGKILVEGNPGKLILQNNVSSMEEVFIKYCKGNLITRPLTGSDEHLDYLTTNCKERTSEIQDYDHLQNECRDVRGICNLGMDISSENTSDDNKNSNNVVLEVNSMSIPGTSQSVANVFELPVISRKETNTLEKSYSAPQNVTHILPKLSSSTWLFPTIILAIFWKNLILLKQNYGFCIFALVFPVSNIFFMKFFLAREPTDLRLAIVNHDESPIFSKQFIDNIDHKIFNSELYSDLEEAVKLLETAKIHAVIHFATSYSRSLLSRARHGISTDNSTIEASLIRLYTDKTNLLLIRSLGKSLFETYRKTTRESLVWLGIEPGVLEAGLKFEKPVLGSEELDYSTVMVNNVYAESIFLITFALSTLVFVGEKTSGLMERSRVSGIKPAQIIASHAMTVTFISGAQIIVLTVYFFSFKVDIKGSFILVICLLFQSSYVGMAIGIFISAVSRNTFTALLVFMGIFWMGSSLSCLMWPVEGQPVGMRILSQAYPSNWNFQALTRVISYGLGLDHILVWRSILLSNGWAILLLLCSVFLFNRSY